MNGAAHDETNGVANNETNGVAHDNDTNGAAHDDTNGAAHDDTNGVKNDETNGVKNDDTNGTVHDDTNGVKNDDTKGVGHDDANGAAHDDTNGTVHDDTNGAAHDDTNGAAHDDTNGIKNDETNGVKNDDTNGTVHDDTNGTAHDDTNGAAHDDTNGVKNDETNGVKNDETNGVENDETHGVENGETNGVANDETNGVENDDTTGVANSETNGAAHDETHGVVENNETNGEANEETHGVENGLENGVTSEENEETTPPKKAKKHDRRTGFLRELFEILLEDAVVDGTDRNNKVVEFVHPKELFQRIDMQLRESGEPDETILQLCRETIHYCVKTGHPHFFNQLWSGLDPYQLGGTWLTESVNTSQYTYEVAPVFTLMEDVVMKKLRDIVGYPGGDGIFSAGGSQANMYGMNLARYQHFPNAKTDGLHGTPRLIVLTSEHSHYSIKKGAGFMGIGVNNVWMVACDERGKMIPSELEKRIEEAKDQGFHPFMVNATAGTTVVGAFDPLDAIADVCEKYGLWMHVDACWGGGALMAPKLRHLFTGIERSDSVAWDPHKLMGTNQQCAVFLTKHENLLTPCNSANATYLFQQDKFYDVSFDTGDKSLQCGRKVDVFKLWLMWKARGDIGFERRIENAFANARYLAESVRQTEGFELVFDKPECVNVCFWYIPPSMREEDRTDEWWQRLGKVAPKVKERMVMAGTMLVGYQPLGSFVNFFRFIIANGDDMTTHDMDFVLDEINKLGEDL